MTEKRLVLRRAAGERPATGIFCGPWSGAAIADGERYRGADRGRALRAQRRAHHLAQRLPRPHLRYPPWRLAIAHSQAAAKPALAKAEGTYFPPFLEARKSSEKALVAVIQEVWIGGVSTRRDDDLVQAMGLAGISKSQVFKLCKSPRESGGDRRARACLSQPPARRRMAVSDCFARQLRRRITGREPYTQTPTVSPKSPWRSAQGYPTSCRTRSFRLYRQPPRLGAP